jgi:thimet oligopeptidase
MARERVSLLEARASDPVWLAAYDDLGAAIEDVSSPLLFLSNVHPDKALRDASEACELRWQDFQSSLNQNEALYKSARQVKAVDPIDVGFLKATLDDLEDSGVGLTPERRARAKAILDRVTELDQSFNRNIRDQNIKLAFADADLKGVPDAVWKNAPRDEQGRRILGVEYPVYFPVMQTAESAATRERMWRAKINEGGEPNLKLLAEIVALRREYAALFDMPSYADFVMRRRMASKAAAVEDFLAEVAAAIKKRELRELAELGADKALHLGLSAQAAPLARWDLAYYTERARQQRYQVDQEAFRPFFPAQESLKFVLRLIEKMMGVRYTAVASAPTWHPEVQAFAVSDAASGKDLAALYVDLYPREGKYGHAAVFPLRGGSTRLARLPQAALVANLDRKGLTLDELETLLHELGHSVHTDMSATRYATQAGTSVKRDFVEAPSQMLEDWVYDRKVLDVFKEVCPACKPVPDDLLAKAVKARDFGKGVRFSRQQLYASYDLTLYGREVVDPMVLWQRMESATPLGHVVGTMLPAGFSHIAGGYAAGYYGYLWSLVVAMDLRTAFAADKLDPAVGQRYRRTVLANGSQRPPQDLIREFLGRETNARAFYDDLAR